MKIIEKKLKNSRPPTIATNEALEQDKVFKLLWILDPSGWEKTIKQAKTRSNWTNVSLPSEDLDMLKKDELKGYIFRVKGNEVVMFDNVSTLIPSCMEIFSCFLYSSISTACSRLRPMISR